MREVGRPRQVPSHFSPISYDELSNALTPLRRIEIQLGSRRHTPKYARQDELTIFGRVRTGQPVREHIGRHHEKSKRH